MAADKPNLGDIPCPLCALPGHVRAFASKNPSGANGLKLYIWCPECGPIMSAAKGAQRAIAAKATMYPESVRAQHAAPAGGDGGAPPAARSRRKKTRRALPRAREPMRAAPVPVQQQQRKTVFFELDD